MADIKVFLFGFSVRVRTLLKGMTDHGANIIVVGGTDAYYDFDRLLRDYAYQLREDGMTVEEGVFCRRNQITVENIRKSGANLVLISSVNASHADDILMAMDAGIHVFCEKPICTTMEDVRRIRVKHLQTGVPIMSGFVLRFAPVWTTVKKLLTDGHNGFKFGKVRSIELDEHLWKGHGALALDTWRGEFELSGGHWVEKMCHPLDLISWYLSDDSENDTNGHTRLPLTVSARSNRRYFKSDNEGLFETAKERNGANYFKKYSTRGTMTYDGDERVGDTLSGVFEFPEATATVTSTTYCTSGGRYMTLHCENHATIKVVARNYQTPYITIEHRGFTRGKSDDMEISETLKFPVAGCHGDGDKFITSAIVNTVLNGAEYPQKTDDFLISTAIAIGAEIASQNGAPYYFDYTVKAWKYLGIPTRIEDYGYFHEYRNPEDNTVKRKFLPCISKLLYRSSITPSEKYFTSTITASFAIPIDEHGNLYLMKHKKRGVDIPGGHVESGEDARVTAMRELAEETGIQCPVYSFLMAGSKVIEAVEHSSIPSEFKYPATSLNSFYYVQIQSKNVNVANRLAVAEDDESEGLVIIPRSEILNYDCVLIHWPMIANAYTMYGIRQY